MFARYEGPGYAAFATLRQTLLRCHFRLYYDVTPRHAAMLICLLLCCADAMLLPRSARYACCCAFTLMPCFLLISLFRCLMP